MATTNRTCLCCGEHFRYCPSCSRADALKEPWHAEFCSETCKDLWYTATRYNMQKLTKQEAQDIIKSLPLKPASEYVACVQRDLGVILKEDPKPKRGKRIMVQPIDDAALIEHEVVNQENE